MSIDAIGFISAGTSAADLAGLHKGSPGNFEAWMGQQLSELGEQLATADLQVRQLASGEASNLHQVMMALEKAKVSFELVVQVRNKLLEGYQEIMRMQV